MTRTDATLKARRFKFIANRAAAAARCTITGATMELISYPAIRTEPEWQERLS